MAAEIATDMSQYFEMKKAECLRYHIWLRVREYIDKYYDFRDERPAGEPRKSRLIIKNIFFRPTDVVIHYYDPGMIRLDDEMMVCAIYPNYSDEPELKALKEIADTLAKMEAIHAEHE